MLSIGKIPLFTLEHQVIFCVIFIKYFKVIQWGPTPGNFCKINNLYMLVYILQRYNINKA